jgi:histidine triad (HIT) family protein
VEGCPFCAIVAGELEASVVHEDEWSLAFLDIRPITPGHTLVVPRAHAASLEDLEVDDGEHLFRVAQRIAARLRRSSLRVEGIHLSLADGAAAGQEVFHIHLHVLPRFRGDGFELKLPPHHTERPRPELDAIAAELRRA